MDESEHEGETEVGVKVVTAFILDYIQEAVISAHTNLDVAALNADAATQPHIETLCQIKVIDFRGAAIIDIGTVQAIAESRPA